MTPFIQTGAIQLPETLSSANDSVLPANADLYAGSALPEQFSELIQNRIGDGQEPDNQSQRLEMIRDAVVDMDDSEVVGFLAMLENQMGWSSQESEMLPSFNPLNYIGEGAPGSVAKEPAQRQIPDLQLSMMNVDGDESVNPASTLSVAVREALNKATENYMPAVREQSDSGDKPILNALTERSVFASTQNDAGGLDLTLDPTLDPKAAMMKLSIQPSTLTIDSPQSGFELSVQDSSRIAPAQAKNELSQLAQTTSEYLSDARPLPNAREAGWSEALGQRLVMMVGEQRQEAQLRLDPPDLGSLGVKLVVEERGVSIQFNSAIPQVRDMLEAQADRLRVAMSMQGLDLVDVNVGDDAHSGEHSKQQSGEPSSSFGGLANRSDDEMLDGQWAEAEVSVPVDQSLINTFA
ncbi:hypothetical protein ACH42_15010 [Endozoicomonas sp. (ex Bugula neritina AB1)]|nr:hypothetical protein ACH42_15010 [Endozoicomonas sp. (ex Bugula neritina AB1)]